MSANAINQLSTANTFQHWLNATESLIATANLLTDGNGSTFYANTKLEIGGTGATLNVTTSATINVLSSNTITAVNTTSNLNATNVTTQYVQFSDGTKQYTANAANTTQTTSIASAFDKANSANVLAQAAFDKANTDATSISTTAGVYGNAVAIPQITLAANGRVSSITNVSISIPTDSSNASNITTGTLPSGRLTGAYTGITSTGTLTGITISGKINETLNTITVGATTSLDLSTNSVYKLVMAANTTLSFVNPPSSGTEVTFKLYANTNNGSNTITWPAEVKWQYGQAPTQTTTANKTDIYSFTTNDGGTTYFGYVSGLNF
jgi:hypothetical protein